MIADLCSKVILTLYQLTFDFDETYVFLYIKSISAKQIKQNKLVLVDNELSCQQSSDATSVYICTCAPSYFLSFVMTHY